jgi:flavodoxin
MKTMVVYDSQFGNTEQVAQVIGDVLRPAGPVQVLRVASAESAGLEGVDLLVLGSPTQGWKATLLMQAFLEKVISQRPQGLAVACFDTRFNKPRLLTGSAASRMAERLHKAGLQSVVPPQSFFVKGSKGPLADGELEQASGWAMNLRQRLESARAGVVTT